MAVRAPAGNRDGRFGLGLTQGFLFPSLSMVRPELPRGTKARPSRGTTVYGI